MKRNRAVARRPRLPARFSLKFGLSSAALQKALYVLSDSQRRFWDAVEPQNQGRITQRIREPENVTRGHAVKTKKIPPKHREAVMRFLYVPLPAFWRLWAVRTVAKRRNVPQSCAGYLRCRNPTLIVVIRRNRLRDWFTKNFSS